MLINFFELQHCTEIKLHFDKKFHFQLNLPKYKILKKKSVTTIYFTISKIYN